MAHPYSVYRPGQGNGWLKSLDKYIETPKNAPTKAVDAEVTLRNHGGDKEATDEASYVDKGKK